MDFNIAGDWQAADTTTHHLEIGRTDQTGENGETLYAVRSNTNPGNVLYPVTAAQLRAFPQSANVRKLIGT